MKKSPSALMNQASTKRIKAVAAASKPPTAEQIAESMEAHARKLLHAASILRDPAK
jgi:hypothetical protein